ncbi:MAG: transposase [Wenzhouxiangella sp.]|nr:MAG: transposase [Wenzhouxiangella sp.]
MEARIIELSECFAVSVYAWAAMSNHAHVVLHVDPGHAQSWSDEEIARRWLTAFPGSLKHDDSEELAEIRKLAITGDPERLAELRKRLGSLSWFMKALNEPIARRANREDGCKGKFWESRFKCQALLEPHAVLSCMAYVDLNPARAAMCDTLADSDFTSIQRRLRERDRLSAKISPGRSLLDRPLKPVAGLDANALMGMTESSYIELVQWTGEQARSDKGGKLKPLAEGKRAAPADIWHVANHPKAWIHQVQGTENIYYRAIGSAEALMAKAEELGQAWMKGMASELARKILRERPT